MDSTTGPRKVLFILSWGRSGSTLLDLGLGSIEGFFSTGELSAFWAALAFRGDPCGCGKRLEDCEVWSKVIHDLVGAAGLDPVRMSNLRLRCSRERHTWRLLRARTRPKNIPIEYLNGMNRLYRSIGLSSGAKVIVDSSKVTSDAALLLLMDEIEPYFVHLVRDPRACAFSWSRTKPQTQREQERTMPRYGNFYSSLRWMSRNAGAELLLRQSGRPWLRLRYEDLVSDPSSAFRSIQQLTGEPHGTLPVRGNTLSLRETHTVSGNPIRTSSGELLIKLDDRWRRLMPFRHKTLVSAITWPLMLRYGYGVR